MGNAIALKKLGSHNMTLAFVGNTTLTASLLDRLLHSEHVVAIRRDRLSTAGEARGVLIHGLTGTGACLSAPPYVRGRTDRDGSSVHATHQTMAC